MEKYDKGLRLIAAAEKAQATGRLRSLARRFDMRIAGVVISRRRRRRILLIRPSDGRRVAFCVLRLCSEARAGFVDGVASLLETVKTESCSDTERLVRRHIARFMAAAEELDRGADPQTPLSSGTSSARPPLEGGQATRPAPALAAVHV